MAFTMKNPERSTITWAPASQIIEAPGETVTSVDFMIEDEAPAEYYNLQGIKVNNPNGGIFIKKQGNKVSKVVLK